MHPCTRTSIHAHFIVFHCWQASLHFLWEYLQPDRCLPLCPFSNFSSDFHMYSKKSEVNSNCEPESADLNTNLCRKGKFCYPCLRKPLSGIHFLCVCPLMCLASCMARGVCNSGRGEKGLRKGQSLSPGLSPPRSSPLSKPQKDVSFPADASAEMPILFLQG